MSTEIAEKEKQDASIVQAKRKAWGDMGEAVYKGEMQLQAQAQVAIQKIKTPKNIQEVPAAEASLKELKASQKTIEASRKQITSRFDEKTAQLMLPEKSLSDPIIQLNAAIIAIKTDYERLEKIKAAKQEEIKAIKERITNLINQKDYEFKSGISTKVTVAYEHALTNDVKPEDAASFIEKCINKIGVLAYEIEKPQFTLKHVLPEEMDLILEETFITNPFAYLTMLKTEMEKKFSDYQVAYSNKKAALDLAKKQEEERQAVLKTELDNKELASKIEASSTQVMSSGPEVKALKKVYEVDMAETCENAIQIMAAFTANLKLCLPKLKVTKWFSFTPGQAAIALSKVKCDDNNFQPSGINFKEVSKL